MNDSYITSVTASYSNMTSYSPDSVTSAHVFVRHTWTSFLAIHSPAALWIDRILTPVWYVIGILGNLVSAKIWSERRMRRNNSSAVYLIALSISDYVFLILHILQELKYSWGLKTLEYPVICEAYFLLVLVVQYLSPMLVLCFTVERYIAVCIPFSKEKYCTSRRATLVVLAVVSLCFGLCAIQAYFWTYDSTSKECRVRAEVMEGGDWSLWTIWSWITEMLIFLVVPFFILIFNALVIREVRRLASSQSCLLAPPTFHGSQAMSSSPSPVMAALPLVSNGFLSYPPGGTRAVSRSESRSEPRSMTARHASVSSTQGGAATTAMLLSVSFYVIVTTLPATLVYVLHSQFPEGDVYLSDDEISRDPAWRRYLIYMTTRKIVEEICLSHYACNVFLYCITGDKFRQILRDWVRLNCGGRSPWSVGGTGFSSGSGVRRTTRVRNEAGEKAVYASIDRRDGASVATCV